MTSDEQVMSRSERVVYKWDEIDWRKLERSVFKLQKRIYQASKSGDWKRMKRLQKLLLKSKSAKLLAVRRVTQINKGKKTAGVDGVKSLSSTQRLKLANELNLSEKSKPVVRRIWIPKPGKTEKRPLGIPTMTDRAKQALAKLVLEPEWEAKFEPNSYGFRSARSCQDAIRAIHTAINHKNAYVLDADIKGCFDNIDHVALLEKLRTFPKLRKVIKGWLRAGVMEGNVFQATRNGTPQGGIISPLLANVALHGLEYETKEALLEYLLKYYKEYKGQANKERAKRALHIIRYADDFVMIHESKEIILKAKEFVEKWFEHIGLKLSNEKTRITYTLKNKEKEKSGFDFLGFQIIQYPNNKRARKYITIAKPSSGSQKRHKKLISIIFKQSAAATQKELIEKLNPIIRGWGNYFRSGASSKTFGYMNYFMFHKLWKWARWRHPNKGLHWIKSKYFRGYKRDTWSFITPDNIRLVRHCKFYIKRHVKIIGTNTPYDGNLNYWAKRLNDGKAMSINKLAERCI